MNVDANGDSVTSFGVTDERTLTIRRLDLRGGGGLSGPSNRLRNIFDSGNSGGGDGGDKMLTGGDKT